MAPWARPAPATAEGRAKALIGIAAEAGAEIEPGALEGAPTFSFIPAPPEERAAARGEAAKAAPSPRGSYSYRLRADWRERGVRHYRPPGIDLAPMYGIPMAGDPPELTRARERWAGRHSWRKLAPDPAPLRDYLAAMAAERRQSAPQPAQRPPRAPERATAAPEAAPTAPGARKLAPPLPRSIAALARPGRARR